MFHLHACILELLLQVNISDALARYWYCFVTSFSSFKPLLISILPHFHNLAIQINVRIPAPDVNFKVLFAEFATHYPLAPQTLSSLYPSLLSSPNSQHPTTRLLQTVSCHLDPKVFPLKINSLLTFWNFLELSRKEQILCELLEWTLEWKSSCLRFTRFMLIVLFYRKQYQDIVRWKICKKFCCSAQNKMVILLFFLLSVM